MAQMGRSTLSSTLFHVILKREDALQHLSAVLHELQRFITMQTYGATSEMFKHIADAQNKCDRSFCSISAQTAFAMSLSIFSITLMSAFALRAFRTFIIIAMHQHIRIHMHHHSEQIHCVSGVVTVSKWVKTEFII